MAAPKKSKGKNITKKPKLGKVILNAAGSARNIVKKGARRIQSEIEKMPKPMKYAPPFSTGYAAIEAGLRADAFIEKQVRKIQKSQKGKKSK